MKYIIFVFISLFFICFACSVQPSMENVTINSLVKGFIKFRGFDNTFDVYIANLEEDNIRFFWKDKSGKIYGSIKNLYYDLEKNNIDLIFAMNGGIFTTGRRPEGLYVENKEELVEINKEESKYGNFYMQPNGIFLIDKDKNAAIIRTTEYSKYESEASEVLYAMQSGPMLLIDGKINDKFKKKSDNKYVRNGVGIIDNKKIVFAISNDRINFYDFATLFKIFGCKNALYLDGATSSTLFINFNHYDNSKEIGTIIGIVK